MNGLRIGEVAKAAQVGVQTVRYYERRGLIAEPPRTPAGYRAYPSSTVDRIRFIRSAAGLGFQLAEVAQLLELRVEPTSNCGAVKRRAVSTMERIDEQIVTLSTMRKALARVVDACDRRSPTGECPILERIEGGGPPMNRLEGDGDGASRPGREE